MDYFSQGTEAIEDAMKSGGGGGDFFKWADGDTVNCRILFNPVEFVLFKEHWDQQDGYSVCVGIQNNCPKCGGHKARSKFITAILNREDNKTYIVDEGKALLEPMMAMYEKYGDLTVMDFEIQRRGEKQETKYIFYPSMEKSEIPATFEKPNLVEIAKRKKTSLGQAPSNTPESSVGFNPDDDDIPF